MVKAESSAHIGHIKPGKMYEVPEEASLSQSWYARVNFTSLVKKRGRTLAQRGFYEPSLDTKKKSYHSVFTY